MEAQYRWGLLVPEARTINVRRSASTAGEIYHCYNRRGGNMTIRKIDMGDGTYKVRTCAWSPPGDHPVGCGMYLTVKDGKVVKVEGDPEHPITNGRVCVRCLALPEWIYSDKRVLTPLKRDPKDRGLDKWEPITWDEAMDIIEAKVREIHENYGFEYIGTFQGTGRAATLYAPALAFAALQTPNAGSVLAGESCYGPRCAVANFILGAGYPELDYAAFFPDRYDDPRYRVPEWIVIWGKNPLYSNPDGLFGHAIIDLLKRGSKYIVIDPRLTWCASRPGAIHCQLRPGTDAALGLGLANIIIQEDLYDHEFVEQWCYGFEEFKARCAEYPVERVSEITWVPEETILKAARAIGTGDPVSFLWGVAIDENPNGVQAGHTFLAIAAITGNLDVPGGVTLAVPASFMGKWRYDCSLQIPPAVYKKQIINPNHKAYVARQQGHPDSMLDALETGIPYKIKMAWFIGTNPLPNMGVQTKRWEEAFKTLELNVIQDTTMTPSAMAFCDIFLPLSTFAEQDGIVLPHFGRNTHFLGAINKAIEMDCKSDLEIAMMIGKRLNPRAWPWETVEEFFTDQIQRNTGMTFPELQDKQFQQMPFEYKKYEKGLLRSDGYPGFNTPTGLVELSASIYPDFDEDSLPYFIEPPYSPYSTPELMEEFPLVMTTGGRMIPYFHSEGRQIPSLRKIVPDPIITINPETAKKYGIEQGDWVKIKNMFGECVQRANISIEVEPRVVHVTHGWWFPEQEGEAPNLFGTYKANVNNLIPHHTTGKMGWGAPYKCIICSIEKCSGMDDYDPNYPEKKFHVTAPTSLDLKTLQEQGDLEDWMWEKEASYARAEALKGGE